MKPEPPRHLKPKCPVKWRISDIYFDGRIDHGKGRLMVFIDMLAIDPRGFRVSLSDETKKCLLEEGAASMKLYWELYGVDDVRKLMCLVDGKSNRRIGKTGFWLDYEHPVDRPVIHHILEMCRYDGQTFRLMKSEMEYGKLLSMKRVPAPPQTIAQLEEGLNSVINIAYQMAKIPDPANITVKR